MQEQIFEASNGILVKYKHKPRKYDFKHLIIVFSGFLKTTPGNYDFENALNDCPCDVIWISDDFEGMYSYYLANDMDFKIEIAITELINRMMHSNELTLKDVTVTGFSKGGSAALYYGIKLNISNIVVTVPQIYIGTYLDSNWKLTAKHIMGLDYNKTKIHYFNNLIPNLLKKDFDRNKNVYLLTSEADEQYEEHIVPNLNELSKYSNFNLIKTYSLFVRQHNHVTSHHTAILLSIYYALASESTPRFNHGQVNFFGSQPVAMEKPSLQPYIDLRKILIIDNLLFIEGIALIRGLDVENYSDIDYKLIFSGIKNYTKNLAKDNRPGLTKEFFKNELIIYDKCYFTTFQYKGMDISEIDIGSYELFIRIKVKGNEFTIPLVSNKKIEYKTSNSRFISDDKANIFELI